MSNVSMIDGHIDEPRLKDKDIIKALECCSKSKSNEECKKLGCPFFDEDIDMCGTINSETIIQVNALDLILRLKADINNYRTRVGNQREELARLNEQVNEQNAEIEQWKEEANRYQNLWCEAVKDIQTAKVDAIKVVTAELYNGLKQYSDYDKHYTFEILNRIDGVEEIVLLKVVGDGNGRTVHI